MSELVSEAETQCNHFSVCFVHFNDNKEKEEGEGCRVMRSCKRIYIPVVKGLVEVKAYPVFLVSGLNLMGRRKMEQVLGRVNILQFGIHQSA